MKNLWWTLAAVLLGAGAASAQRAVAPRPSLEAFRPVGEYRLWTFIQKDTVLGTIASTVERTVEIGGLRGYALREDFLLDFTKRSGENRFAAAGEHFVGADGAYLGDDLKLNVNGQEGRINVKRKGDVIRGLVGQGRQRREATVTVPSGMFAIDNYMADQFEIYFALRGLTAGETIDDSIFVPRDLLAAPLRGRVTNFSWVQLYKGVFDSVFTVQLDQPVPVELYINRELHLRKLNYRAQDMRVYLDVVREQAELVKPRLTLGALARMIPKYLVFALIGLVGLVLYAGSAVRRLTLWLGALTGAVGF
ncbi:MAG TPA: hypothetical protein PKM94_06645, partial [candidate division Zixibacteria bacterium]|nr:hypothetical protein [candidate division Zixibacteria bacterium]